MFDVVLQEIPLTTVVAIGVFVLLILRMVLGYLMP
jgi:hypothetical protein